MVLIPMIHISVDNFMIFKNIYFFPLLSRKDKKVMNFIIHDPLIN